MTIAPVDKDKTNKFMSEYMDYPTSMTFLFNKDWNLLMEVISKIQNEDIVNEFRIRAKDNNTIVSISTKESISNPSSTFMSIRPNRLKIDATYDACLKFIRYINAYNKIDEIKNRK